MCAQQLTPKELSISSELPTPKVGGIGKLYVENDLAGRGKERRKCFSDPGSNTLGFSNLQGIQKCLTSVWLSIGNCLSLLLFLLPVP